MNKKLSPEEKSEIILEGLSKNTKIKELCKKYSISKMQFYRWKKKFIEAGRKGLKDNRKSCNDLKRRNLYLRRLIYKLQIIISILKEKITNSELEELMDRLTEHGLTKKETIKYLGKRIGDDN